MVYLKKLLPSSLFGRLILVFFAGLSTILAISMALNYEEREQLLLRIGGEETAYRIADTVILLDSLEKTERERVVPTLNIPPQQVQLRQSPVTFRDTPAIDSRTIHLLDTLKEAIGQNRNILVRLRAPLSQENIEIPHECRPMGRMGGMGRMRRGEHHMDMRLERNPLCDPLPMYNYDSNFATAYFVQVQLTDGQWVAFDTLVFKKEPIASSRMMTTLIFILLGILLLLYLTVRWVTRPLKILSEEADALGVDINKPPIPEKGPREIKRAAHAFNTMQQRLKNLIQDRTNIFAAMSHDLKTPITRLRLRTELLEDTNLRESFEKDLKEMEYMVTESLSFMRGIDTSEKSQPVNINALFESLQEDYQEMGKTVSLNGKAQAPLMGSAPLLKRCLTNLIDNAIFYGQQAHITIEDSPDQLLIRIRDEGPGIPESELEKVFNPFYRLEQSRNRQTGGTGLGLPLARNIIHLHGGKIALYNKPQAGLEVRITLPRLPAYGN